MRSFAIGLALSLALAAPSALADVPALGQGSVFLKDGRVIKGRIAEVRPSDHVTVVLPDGSSATINWNVIEHIEAVAAGPLPPGSPGAVPPAPPKTAMVHIESDRPVRLEVQSGSRSWAAVCTSPCDQEVEIGPTYRILGDGVRGTAPFEIAARAGQRVVIDVDTSSKGAFVGGIILVSVSPVVSLVGLVVWAIAAASEISGTDNSSGRNVGIGLAVGGLVGIAAGVVLIITSSSSKQTQSLAGPSPGPGAPPRDARDLLREPTWATLPITPVAPAAAVQIPLLRF